MNKQIDHIVFCCNDGYFYPFLTVVYSISKHYNKKRTINFHLLYKCNNISRLSISIATQFINSCGHIFTPHEIRRETDFNRTISRITEETFFRYFIAETIPCKKALYLDADILVRKDISSLFEIDISNSLIAGVDDPFIKSIDYLKSNDAFSEHDNYFNAGVLLINCEKFRSDNLIDKIVSTSLKYQDTFEYQDQDVLNHACWPEITWLNESYNLTSASFGKKYSKIKDPHIVHWTGPNKPWDAKCERTIFRVEYAQDYKETVNKLIKL